MGQWAAQCSVLGESGIVCAKMAEPIERQFVAVNGVCSMNRV